MNTLFIRRLSVPVIIGCLPQERRNKQVIEIDLEMKLDIEQAVQSDDIHHALNYFELTEKIKSWLAKTDFKLIETLAEFLAKKILSNYKVSWLRLSITKHPVDMKEVAGVGITIERP